MKRAADPEKSTKAKKAKYDFTQAEKLHCQERKFRAANIVASKYVVMQLSRLDNNLGHQSLKDHAKTSFDASLKPCQEIVAYQPAMITTTDAYTFLFRHDLATCVDIEFDLGLQALVWEVEQLGLLEDEIKMTETFKFAIVWPTQTAITKQVWFN